MSTEKFLFYKTSISREQQQRGIGRGCESFGYSRRHRNIDGRLRGRHGRDPIDRGLRPRHSAIGHRPRRRRADFPSTPAAFAIAWVAPGAGICRRPRRCFCPCFSSFRCSCPCLLCRLCRSRFRCSLVCGRLPSTLQTHPQPNRNGSRAASALDIQRFSDRVSCSLSRRIRGRGVSSTTAANSVI